MATPAHMKAPRRQPRRTTVVVGVIGAAALLSVAAVAEAYGDHGQTPSQPATAVSASGPTSGTATPRLVDRSGGSKTQSNRAKDGADSSKVGKVVTPDPLVVTAITPGSGTTGVTANSALTVAYSEPLSATPPLPTLSPAVAGTWTASGAVLTFVPSGGWIPYSTETVTVPAGATAVVGGTKTSSVAATTTTFKVAPGDRNRLEQLLADLNYLPFTFTPTALPAGVTTGAAAEATTANAVVTSPIAGTLNWAYPNIPPSLSALWTPGQANVIDKGAVMAFQSVANLPMDGVAGPQVWTALLAAVAARQVNPNPYDYLMASESGPETLQVWRNGTVIYSTPSNTGVPGATTEAGTFPVYERQASGTMTGTDVDGTKYVDPGIPWIAYFNGGDAVHGYVRTEYGFPQSNGCVELPVANAAQVWTMDPYGTLVTVLPSS